MIDGTAFALYSMHSGSSLFSSCWWGAGGGTARARLGSSRYLIVFWLAGRAFLSLTPGCGGLVSMATLSTSMVKIFLGGVIYNTHYEHYR